MPARKNPRLAYSEYVAPGSIDADQARRILMLRVRKVFPRMLEQLAAEVLPAYESIYEALPKFDFNESILSRVSPFEELRPDSTLRAALLKWASEFHAEEGWFLDDILRTLHGWHVAPGWRAKLRCNSTGRAFNTLAVGETFQFECEGWEMQLFSWTRYRRFVQDRFKQHLREYEAASRKLAESRGLVHARHKYSPVNLDWFVLYQFAGLSSKEIADRPDADPCGESEGTILKGVKAAARLIGWDSRRQTLGRLNRKIR